MNIPEVLYDVAAALDRAGIAYMLTGSFASAYYGSPRSTQDIDLVIAPTAAELQAFVQLLPSEKYYVDLDAAQEALKRQSLFNVIEQTTGWKIDLILRKSRPFSQEEFRRRRLVNFKDVAVFVATAEDVIIAKLEWSKLARSKRQIEDVVTILKARWKSLDRSYLEKWIVELGLREEWNEAIQLAGFSDVL